MISPPLLISNKQTNTPFLSNLLHIRTQKKMEIEAFIKHTCTSHLSLSLSLSLRHRLTGLRPARPAEPATGHDGDTAEPLWRRWRWLFRWFSPTSKTPPPRQLCSFDGRRRTAACGGGVAAE
ncbi:hypothetical protein Hdeb2414_s0004g00129061 [Helianthus debilis subsp. tardiflorus]